jgi:quercetin dioxygenase-like cupin family protein
MKYVEDRIMATIVQETRYQLAKHELLALEHRSGHLLTCISGELWLTVDGEQEDVILLPGQVWRVPGNVPVVVSALRPALLVATRPPCHESPPDQRRAAMLLSLLMRWRHPPLAAHPASLIR